MQFVVQTLIDRARTYIGDDHNDEPAFITPARWLDLFNVEYRKLYRRWVSGGLVTPPITQQVLTGATSTVTGVLAIVGVAEDLGSAMRVLRAAEVDEGLRPYWRASAEPTSRAESWSARGFGDNVTVELEPQDPNASTGAYKIRFIATPVAVTSATSTVEIPFGADERLVLGMARRALLKESGASRRLDEELRDADAELGFLSFGRLQPRVRRKEFRTPLFELDPSRWRYFG